TVAMLKVRPFTGRNVPDDPSESAWSADLLTGRMDTVNAGVTRCQVGRSGNSRLIPTKTSVDHVVRSTKRRSSSVVERPPCKRQAVGSIPTSGSRRAGTTLCPQWSVSTNDGPRPSWQGRSGAVRGEAGGVSGSEAERLPCVGPDVA